MTNIEVIPRKWGNSIAIIIPAEIVEKQKIRENKPIIIKVTQKRPKAGVLWGYLKEWKTPTQQLKEGARAGWMSTADIKEEKAWRARQKRK